MAAPTLIKGVPFLLQKTKVLVESKSTRIVDYIDTKLARICSSEVGDIEAQTSGFLGLLRKVLETFD